MAHWLNMMNILCKRSGVKGRNCYQRATLTSVVAHLHFHIPEFIDRKTGKRTVSTSIQLTS